VSCISICPTSRTRAHLCTTSFCVGAAKKAEGNNFFKNKQYAEAIAKYTEAIAEDPTDVTFYSNRSACYAALNQWAEAADDGRTCIITDKNFVKGYFRMGLAMQNMQNFDGALEAVKRGLGMYVIITMLEGVVSLLLVTYLFSYLPCPYSESHKTPT
jgi:tetratricopeptide (TPR) repeat protein